MNKKRIQITIDRLVNPHNYAHKGMDYSGYGRKISKRLEKSLHKAIWRRCQRLKRTKDLEYTFLFGIEKHRPGIDFIDKDKTQEKFFEYLKKHNIEYQYGFDSFGDTVFCLDWNKYNKLEEIADRLFDDVGFIHESHVNCGHCNNMIPAQPGYYGDQVRYKILHDYLICEKCLKENPELLIEDCINDTGKSVPSWFLPFVKQEGFIKFFDEDRESGFHYGQNDNPETDLNLLEANIDNDVDFDFIFGITDVGQFDIHYNLYYRMNK